MDHFAVSRLEIDAVNEIAIDRPTFTEVRRTSEKRHLGAASLHRQRATHSGCQPSRPRTRGQDQRLANETSLVRFHAFDFPAILNNRLDLDTFSNVRSQELGGVRERGDDLDGLDVSRLGFENG